MERRAVARSLGVKLSGSVNRSFMYGVRTDVDDMCGMNGEYLESWRLEVSHVDCVEERIRQSDYRG